MTGPRDLDAGRRSTVDALFERLPVDYQLLRVELEALQLAVRRRTAEAFQGALNTRLQKEWTGGVAYPSELAEYVDMATRALGICVSVDARPALLIAEPGARRGREQPNFSIIASGKGRRPDRKVVANDLPELTLMAAPADVESVLEPLRRHAQRTGRQP